MTSLVIGVDPGNVSSGLSIWVKGGLVHHATYYPWKERIWVRLQAAEKYIRRAWAPKPCVYVEVPQNGTHNSRGGVHWAGGMIVSSLLSAGLHVSRGRTKKVTPSEWRSVIMPGKPAGKDWTKEELLAEAARWAITEPQSEDESEAILIGAAGVLMRGGTPLGRRD